MSERFGCVYCTCVCVCVATATHLFFIFHVYRARPTQTISPSQRKVSDEEQAASGKTCGTSWRNKTTLSSRHFIIRILLIINFCYWCNDRFKDLKWKIIIAIGICVLIVVIVVPIVKAYVENFPLCQW